MIAHLFRGRARHRRGAILVVSLAFLVAFLGLAAVVATTTTADRVASINLSNSTQADYAAAAALEAAAFWLDGQGAATPTAINNAINHPSTGRLAASAAGPRSASLDQACQEWWVESFNQATVEATVRAQGWSPGQIDSSGCIVRANSRVPSGIEIQAVLKRQGNNRWQVISRAVVPLNRS